MMPRSTRRRPSHPARLRPRNGSTGKMAVPPAPLGPPWDRCLRQALPILPDILHKCHTPFVTSSLTHVTDALARCVPAEGSTKGGDFAHPCVSSGEGPGPSGEAAASA